VSGDPTARRGWLPVEQRTTETGPAGSVWLIWTEWM